MENNPEKSAVQIRPANKSDIESILEIYNEVLLNTTATFEEHVRPLSEFTQSYEEKMASGIPWIVAEVGDRVVGYGTYAGFRRASGYKLTVEHSLHISPGHRGRGIGSKILKELIHLAKTRGLENMIAGIDSSNAPSILLHERFGFKKVGELTNVAHKFSKSLDLTFMQLSLNH